ncbi:hypothetical protein N7524_006711 [Penicillium chrysogenum]|nr:hypothetical protein N7524_006711 [Penicillium chrysogenum]
MSTTTTSLTTTLVAPAMKGAISEKQCPMCWGEGFPNGSGAQDRIQELEGQVHALTARASATASKLSQYEEEIRHLRSSQPQGSYHTPRSSSSLGRPPSQTEHSSPQRPTSSESQPQPQTYQSRLTNLASLLPYRRGSTTPASAPSTSSGAPPPDYPDYLDNTPSTYRLREAAESQLSQASTELEELTVQLFSQANEMVAEERKARAKLEERVAVLERRDVEKRTRLERLEKAMARVERLRALVNHQ